MKNIIYTLFIGLAAAAFTSCSDDENFPDVRPSDRGTVTDNDGNVYEWVRIGDQMWTTSNAKNGAFLGDAEYYTNWAYDYVLDESEVDDYLENYLPVYGNLVTLKDAIDNAPEGWHVPTDEDWKKLERTLGMKDADASGFRGEGVAFSMQRKDDGPQLGLDLSGACIPKKSYGSIYVHLDLIGEHGYYWTSTFDDSYDVDIPMAYFRRITANYGKVSRGCIRADSYMSVRWVKDV